MPCVRATSSSSGRERWSRSTASSSSNAAIDESALTGEPFPVTYSRDGSVRSGSANAGDAFELRALRPAAESAYAGIVELVRHAERSARRSSVWPTGTPRCFLPLALAVAGGAWALRRRSDALPRGHGRSHAVPPDPRRADRLHRRRLASRAGGRDRQERRCHRAARRGAERPPRQDGHRDARTARGRAGRRARRLRARRAPAPGRLRRPALGPRPRGGARPRRRGARRDPHGAETASRRGSGRASRGRSARAA